ncbi:MAG: four-carbon acid sugar kinase family protein [Spirochaetaceae bacterium]|nr:four-carbon acid sugar kinase family protein [Spirochaetaceae bacterium]MCF7951456.1 four-carbon acid sugar kinase family protein [Spirochaetaceae bacterium]
MKLGVIADDFTGATDIAGFLVEYGIPTIQINGVPDPSFHAEAEAYVISLKTRTCPVDQAVDQSCRAMAWLQQMDCDRFYFKYCSTFDSTPRGNIGPVADALLQTSGSGFTVLCPALPVNGRTVYKGYLFVHDQLLSESGMKDHPLNPMGDAKLSRLLEPQTDGQVASVYAEQIDRGAAAVRQQLEQQARDGYRYAVLDTLHEQHLLTLAEAVEGMPLLTGGSGLAMGLAQLQNKGAAAVTEAKQMGRPGAGKTVVLSGSCSEATNRQVGVYRKKAPSLRIDPARCLQEAGYGEELLQWAKVQLEAGYAPMLYATAAGEELRANRDKYGGTKLGAAIEELFGGLAMRLAEAGVQNFIVAGGETSGQVVQSLGIRAFRIGPQVSPGVPWVKAVDGPHALVLKSGNFGDDDFFARSQEFCKG